MKEPTPILKVYQGFASRKGTYVFGHVLRTMSPQREKLTRNPFKNALEMVRRYRVKPWPGEMVILTLENALYRQQADARGFFTFQVPTPGYAEKFCARVKVAAYPDECEELMLEVKDPPEVIISDIDDTVLISHSTSLIKKLFLLLTKNHERRKVFKGIRDFYTILDGAYGENEFFYVSSSEWNLYDFLSDFITFNKLPQGVFLLQDIRSGLVDLFRSGSGSHQHKYDKIKLVLEAYPSAVFVLVGDSGQQDPYIYQRVAQEFPGRIRKIYIRDVRSSRRLRVRQVAEKLREVNVPLEIFDDSRTEF